MKLPPFKDEDLDPQIIEALKRLDVAKAAYANAVYNIDNQFLVALRGRGFADQADAVKALF